MLLNDSSFFLSFLGEVGRDLWLPLKAKKKTHWGLIFLSSFKTEN